jgi:cell division protein FtsX
MANLLEIAVGAIVAFVMLYLFTTLYTMFTWNSQVTNCGGSQCFTSTTQSLLQLIPILIPIGIVIALVYSTFGQQK